MKGLRVVITLSFISGTVLAGWIMPLHWPFHSYCILYGICILALFYSRKNRKLFLTVCCISFIICGMQRRFIMGQTQSPLEVKVDEWGEKVRQRVRGRIEKVITDNSQRAIASALLLGDKSTLDRNTKVAFRNAGISHTLALSGMHVAIIWGIVCLFFSALRWDYRTKTAGVWLSCTVIFLYAICTGLSPSVSRACIMLSTWKICQAAGNSDDRLGPLLVSAIAIVLFNPMAVNMIGFQLSYAAVLGIVFIYPAFDESIKSVMKKKRSFHTENTKASTVVSRSEKRVRNFFRSIVSGILQLGGITLSCQIATTPLVLLYFGKTSGIFMLSNILSAPLVTLSVYGTIASAILCDIPLLGNLTGKISSLILECLHRAVMFLGS